MGPGRSPDAPHLDSHEAMGHREDFQAGLQALQSGDPAGALRGFEAVLAQRPASVDATFLAGIALVGLGRTDEGITRLRAATTLAPDRAALHYNLGKALQDAGRAGEAEQAYRRALALQPDFAEVQANLALVLKGRGETAEASALFQESFLVRRATRPPDLSGVHTTRLRLAHDLEQLDHLAAAGRPVPDHAAVRAATAGVLARLPDTGPATAQHALSAADQAALAPSYGRALHLEPGEVLDVPVLGPGLETSAVEGAYLSTDPHLCVVDDVFSPSALAALRRHCLDSTFWHASRYRGGYLGAYWEQGFGSPLLVQLAQALRDALPGMLGPHPLQQLWAYKYDSQGGGIGVHADSAAVNVNLWLTPDDANLDPSCGGLVVHHTKAPRDWTHADYNSWDSEDRIEALLAAEDRGSTVVPYRCNRAVIFDSDLFHRTDRYRFAPGYPNRRINVTMLFGWRDGLR